MIKKIFRKIVPTKKNVDDRFRIYLTFECNLKCTYCVNEFLPEEDKKYTYSLLTGNQWIDIIKSVNKSNIVFTGGEPFLHPDILQIINGIPKNIHITIYSNLTCIPKDLSKKLTREITFYGSYHPCSGSPETFLENLSILQESNYCSGTIHAIKTNNNTKFLEDVKKRFKNDGWNLYLDDDQYELFEGSSKKFRKTVKCSRQIYLIAPDGTRYPCVSKMIRRVGGHENLLNEHLKNHWISGICNDYGYCAPCDGLGNNKFEFLD